MPSERKNEKFGTWSWNFTRKCSSNPSSAELPESACGLALLVGNDPKVIGDSLRLVLAKDPQLLFAIGTEK
jgi:hypothetical protein